MNFYMCSTEIIILTLHLLNIGHSPASPSAHYVKDRQREVCVSELWSSCSTHSTKQATFLSNTELEIEKCRKLILSWKVVPHTVINYSSQGHALKCGSQRAKKTRWWWCKWAVMQHLNLMWASKNKLTAYRLERMCNRFLCLLVGT